MSLDALDLSLKIIPIAIAVIALIYAIKQRNVVRNEITKKKYLESALTNLNEQIEKLNQIEMIKLSTSNPFFVELSDRLLVDAVADSEFLALDLWKASYELKTKKFNMFTSYEAKFLLKNSTDNRELNISELSLESFKTFLWSEDGFIYVSSNTEIEGYGRNCGNSPEFYPCLFRLRVIIEVIKGLNKYGEVYENISPNLIKQLSETAEEIIDNLFSYITVNRNYQIDLETFSRVSEIEIFLIETITGLSAMETNFQKIPEICAALMETRKQLFLKLT